MPPDCHSLGLAESVVKIVALLRSCVGLGRGKCNVIQKDLSSDRSTLKFRNIDTRRPRPTSHNRPLWFHVETQLELARPRFLPSFLVDGIPTTHADDTNWRAYQKFFPKMFMILREPNYTAR